MSPGYRTLFFCFARTYLMGVAFNTKGLQNVGLAYAMDPGLKVFYSTPEELQQARHRYLAVYNTHPWWNPLLVGYFLFLESHICKGTLSVQAIDRIKTTTTYTLSAIGDSFFGGSLMVFWSLSEAAFLLQGMFWPALAWLLCPLLLLQGFKLGTFWLGWKKGLAMLQQLRELNLMAWSERIKLANALLIALFWAVLFCGEPNGLWPLAGAVLPAGAAYLVAVRRVPREAFLGLLALVLFAWTMFP
ncbi:MAG: PTS system mannose/fructose/sorbose family transporter subunit IID [Desulfohalobiaceae bacterium]